MARVTLWSILLGFALFPQVAGAQSQSSNLGASATAEALFRAGREAIRAGQTSRACGYFRESQRLEPMLGTQLNLALCEEEQGHLVSAWQLAADLVHAPNLDPQRREVLSRLLERLERSLAFLILERATNLPSDSRVRLPHSEVGADAFGAAIPLEPGARNVDVLAPGRWPRRLRLELSAGERRRVVVVAGPLIHSPARPRPVSRSGTVGKPWVILTAGAAGAGFVASGILGLQALQEKGAMRRECDPSGCSEQGLASARRGESLAQASTLTFVGASLALSASVLLYLLGERDAASVARTGSNLTLQY